MSYKVKCDWVNGGQVYTPAPYDSPPSVMIQVGDTNGVKYASGETAIYGWLKHVTTAMTGTARAVRGNANTLVASTGTFRGVEGRAGSGTSASATDGVNVTTLEGVYGLVACAGGTSTITNARAVSADLDIDITGLTVTNAAAFYANINTGASTVTNFYGVHIKHVSTGASPATLDAVFRYEVESSGPYYCAFDIGGAPTAVNTNQNILMKFVDTTGTTRYLVYDPDSATAVAVTNSVS